jgi:ABC-type transport system involved in multi-copper enzyme maturation permease subunit
MSATVLSPYRSPQRGGDDTFLRLVHAEWTKFRTLRGWVIAVVLAVVLIDLVALLVPRGKIQCGNGSGGSCLPSVPIGPGGEAVNDSYTLAAKPLTGNGSITVQVTSLTGVIENDGGFVGPNTPPSSPGVVPWAKAGIIVTASTRPGSAYAAMMVTGGHGVRMQYDYTNDIAGLPGSVSAASPRWLRLTRSGDVVTGYDSANGRSWTEVGTARLAGLTGTVQAGMFATSPLQFTPNFPTYGESGGGTDTTVATGTFGHVDLRGGPSGGGWDGRVVNAGDANYNGPAPRGLGLRQADGQFAVTGSGDIGPVVAAGVNTNYDTGTLADHLLGVFFGLLILVVIGAMFMTVEYRRGLIRTTMAASPRRGRLLAAKAVVIGLVTFVLGSAAVAVAVTAGSLIAHSSGIYVLPVSLLTRVQVILGTGAMLAVASVLALSIGTILRRSVMTVAAVVVAVILPYVLGVSGALPAGPAEWLLRVTPAAAFAIEQSVPQYPQVLGHYGPPDYFPLAPWTGFAVLCAYALAGLVLATYLLRRRDA